MKSLGYLTFVVSLMAVCTAVAQSSSSVSGWIYVTGASCTSGSSWHFQCSSAAVWHAAGPTEGAYVATCVVANGNTCATSGTGIPPVNRLWLATGSLLPDTLVRVCAVQPGAGRDGCPDEQNRYVAASSIAGLLDGNQVSQQESASGEPDATPEIPALIAESEIGPDELERVIGHLQSRQVEESYWIVEMEGRAPEFFNDAKEATMAMVRLTTENPDKDVTIHRTGVSYAFRMIPVSASAQ